MNFGLPKLTFPNGPQGSKDNAKNPFGSSPLPALNLSGYYLRPILAKDLPTWFNYLRLPEVKEQSSWQLKSAEDLQQFIQVQDWSQPLAQIKFAVTNQQDELIGTIGFHTYAKANFSAEIAYDLSPAYWGKGIASSACQALTNWAHQEIGLVRVQACVLDSNFRSLNVLQRCQFEREGLLRRYKHIHGRARDYWILSHIRAS
ncbi:GNAT family N-acetyltransferase [Undibacterium macrobrachii]|uniref:N-acetyltransferase domain-containing protein n=1 Tax=Undibacterium macrobrachii TaxID=1119058 RepID=A0ABQ2XHQ6_9BURK|nr:GNAT family protein [Undibacterium macrobrachii]GGX18284.1 hypothetical protein GCM10011282_25570 [Undibacterium macrobrachii]